MTKRRPIPPSDAQLNANALVRRAAPYSTTHARSVEYQWDYRAHIPDDLRGMVRAVRRAYEDEVPTKLHEGPDNIGEGGTPKMTERAEGYLFGSPHADDAPKGEQPLLAYYRAPFKAALAGMEAGKEQSQRYAAIIRSVTFGLHANTPDATGAMFAVMDQGIPDWAARPVAEAACRAFLGRMTDVKIRLPKEDVAA